MFKLGKVNAENIENARRAVETALNLEEHAEEEVKNGECGGINAIIPKGAKKIPKGKTIYEFDSNPLLLKTGFKISLILTEELLSKFFNSASRSFEFFDN